MFWWELPFNHHQVPWEPEPNVFFKLEWQHETSHSKGPWNPWNSVDAEWDKCGLGGNCRKSPCSQWIAMGMFVDDESLNHIKGWWMFRVHFLMSLRTTENWFWKWMCSSIRPFRIFRKFVFTEKWLKQRQWITSIGIVKIAEENMDFDIYQWSEKLWTCPQTCRSCTVKQRQCAVLVCWLFGSPPHVPAWHSSRSLCKFSPSS